MKISSGNNLLWKLFKLSHFYEKITHTPTFPVELPNRNHNNKVKGYNVVIITTTNNKGGYGGKVGVEIGGSVL